MLRSNRYLTYHQTMKPATFIFSQWAALEKVGPTQGQRQPLRSMGGSCSGHTGHLLIPDFQFLILRYLGVGISQLRKEMTETQTGEVKFAQGGKEAQRARLSIPDHLMPGSFPLTAVSTLLQTQLPPLLSLPSFADLLSCEVSLCVCSSVMSDSL